MTRELVHLEVSRGVGTITLDSPHNRNALSRQLIADLDRHLTAALSDPGARVLVLTGAGPAFCSGADLKERRGADSAAPPGRPGGLVPILAAMWEATKPIVGRINGPARAGGVGLIAACDIAVAVESATFAVNEVRIGVIPAIVSVVLVPKIGETRAMELFLTGDAFHARAAVTYGLLTAVAPDDELDEGVGRYVASLLKGAPGALAGSKRLVRDVPKLAMEAAFVEMAERSARFFASDEAREGMAAFAEKRPPYWAREA
jgi:methylglutaconyl-CoA hydratase